MLSCPKFSTGLVALALALPASAALLISAPDEASAKRFRFSKHHSESSGHHDAGPAKHHEDADGATAAGSDGPSHVYVPKLKVSSSEDEKPGEPTAEAGKAADEAPPATAEDKSTPVEPSEKSAESAPAAPADMPKSVEIPAQPSEQKAAEQSAEPKPVEPAETARTNPTEAAKPEPKAAEAAPAAKPAKSAKAAAVPHKKHPLAEGQPGMDVVVCEAGCTNSKEIEQVVYVQPTTARTATISEVQPTSTTPAGPAIVCVGGCYSSPKSYRSSMTAEQWQASLTTQKSKPAEMGSGAWLRKIDEARGIEQGGDNESASKAPMPAHAPRSKGDAN